MILRIIICVSKARRAPLVAAGKRKNSHLFHDAHMYIVAAVAATSTNAARARRAAGRAVASGATASCGRRGAGGVSGARIDTPDSTALETKRWY